MDIAAPEPDRRMRVAAALPVCLILAPLLLLDLVYTLVLFQGTRDGTWRVVGNVAAGLLLALLVSTVVLALVQVAAARTVPWLLAVLGADALAAVILAIVLVPRQVEWFWLGVFGPQLAVVAFAFWALRRR